MAGEKIYDLGQVLNRMWLEKAKIQLCIQDGRTQWRLFHVAKVLKSQYPDLSREHTIRALANIFPGITTRTLYRWYNAEWQFVTMYEKAHARFIQGLPESGLDLFKIHVLKKGLVIGYALACMDQLECVVLKEPPAPEVKPEPEKAEPIQMFPETTRFAEPQTLEDLVIEVCKVFSSGEYTIIEACNKFGLTWIQFVETVGSNTYCANIYQTAIKIANMLQSSRQLTLADKNLIKLLEAGEHVTETIHYQKKMIPGQLT